MKYLIKIDFSRLKNKDRLVFKEKISRKEFQKYIADDQKGNKLFTDEVVVLTIPLYDFLIYDIEDTKKYRKNIILSLLTYNEEDNEYKNILSNIKIRTDEYDEFLRTIRFNEKQTA